jgi:hypothetical protein
MALVGFACCTQYLGTTPQSSLQLNTRLTPSWLTQADWSTTNTTTTTLDYGRDYTPTTTTSTTTTAPPYKPTPTTCRICRGPTRTTGITTCRQCDFRTNECRTCHNLYICPFSDQPQQGSAPNTLPASASSTNGQNFTSTSSGTNLTFADAHTQTDTFPLTPPDMPSQPLPSAVNCEGCHSRANAYCLHCYTPLCLRCF